MFLDAKAVDRMSLESILERYNLGNTMVRVDAMRDVL
jgi:hypothetical protein